MDALPVELQVKSIPKTPLHIQCAVRDRLNPNKFIARSGYDTKNNTSNPFLERNLTAQTIQNQLLLAFSSLQADNRISDVDIANMADFGELDYSAGLKKKNLWFQITSKADFTLSSSVLLPSQIGKVEGQSTEFDEFENEEFAVFINSILKKRADKSILRKFSILRNEMPHFVSGFKVYSNQLRFPAMNLCIEYKRDMELYIDQSEEFVGQCGLYLLASSIAYAKFRKHDKPFMTTGIVTDGRRYKFLAFQLNTLDFDSTIVRNVFWRKDLNLYYDGKFDDEAWVQLKEILAYPMKLNAKPNKN